MSRASRPARGSHPNRFNAVLRLQAGRERYVGRSYLGRYFDSHSPKRFWGDQSLVEVPTRFKQVPLDSFYRESFRSNDRRQLSIKRSQSDVPSGLTCFCSDRQLQFAPCFGGWIICLRNRG